MIKWLEMGPGQYKAQVAGICEVVAIHQPRIDKWVGQVLVAHDGTLTTLGAGKFDTLQEAQQAAMGKAGRLLLNGLHELFNSL